MATIKQIVALILALTIAALPITCADEALSAMVAPGASPGVSDVVLPPEEGLLPFSLELRYGPTGYTLYGTVADITADMDGIVPWYSVDGESYTQVEEADNLWQVISDDPDLRTQNCFYPTQTPLKEFLEERINTFYVKLKIAYKDGTESWTEAACLARASEPKPLPEDCQLLAVYGPSILKRVTFRPPTFRGQYHFTVADTATPAELMALLPVQIPVELQITPQGEQVPHIHGAEYTAMWPPIQAVDGETLAVVATGTTPPKELLVPMGTGLYRIQNREIPFAWPELRATFHRIPAGTASQLLLSTGETGEELVATLPLRPTGAQAIIPEYSLDGGASWLALPDVLPSRPVATTRPSLESYTVDIMDASSAPMQAYAAQTLPGFSVRLRIEGGALAGLSQVAVWPADYLYTPPRDDTQDDGGTGNNGNIGAGDGGGTQEGQRPTLPQEEATPPPQLPPAPAPRAVATLAPQGGPVAGDTPTQEPIRPSDQENPLAGPPEQPEDLPTAPGSPPPTAPAGKATSMLPFLILALVCGAAAVLGLLHKVRQWLRG